uniref:Nephrin n=1 Tax=Cacopsylla melanoneura TaxID=428564 RepID=A0A8D8YLF4_9HEMI
MTSSGAGECRLGALLVWCGIFTTLAGAAHSAKDVPIYHIRGIVGDPVYLPCDISTPDDPDDHVLLVLWYREDLGTPIYSVDARTKDFRHAEKWADENVFSGRAAFLPERQPAQLEIKRISESDAQMYRCRVDFQLAQTRNSKVNLTIIVPPNNVSILDGRNMRATSFVGPYLEGQTVTLTCLVSGGNPAPWIVWYRNDRLISNVSTAETGQLSSSITLENLSRKDLHSQLMCTSNNNHKSHPVSASLTVDMNFRPLDIRILESSQPLSAGRRYDLLCQSSGSRPPAKVTWWRDGQRMENTKETTSQDGNMTTSTLSLVPNKHDSGRRLSCRAENPLINESAPLFSEDWDLHIQFVPETRLTLGRSLNPDHIKEDSDVYFDCDIVAMPPVYKVEWRHNNKTLHHNIAQGIIMTNQSLVLQRVNRQSAGNYTCVGFNIEGDGESNAFYLNVMYSPTCKPHQQRVLGVARQEKVNISCEVDANPPDVKFSWTFNNSAETVNVAQALILRSGTLSVIAYSPTTELDYGTLICWASNKIGHQRVPCVFHIVSAGPPDPVQNCSVANMSLNSFQLWCVEGSSNGLTQSFVAEVRDSGTQVLKANVTSPISKFSVVGLDTGVTYQVLVYAFNSKGRSKPMFLQANTLSEPEKQLPSEANKRPNVKLSPTLSIVLGVGGLFVVISCIAATVMKFKCSSRSNENSKKNDRNRSSSGSASGDKSGSSPIKNDSVDSGGDSDEKNPDIIPQPMGDMDDHTDYFRKRQHISTIETRASPTRTLLQGPGMYPGYCTIRNGGLPMQELSNLASKSNVGSLENMYVSGQCTLPRGQWAQYGGGVAGVRSRPQGTVIRTRPNIPPSVAEEDSPGSTKRESTV